MLLIVQAWFLIAAMPFSYREARKSLQTDLVIYYF